MPSKRPGVKLDPFAPEVSGVSNAQRLKEQAGQAGKKKRARRRASYDLPQKIIDAVKRWATDEDLAQGDIVAWALIDLLERHQQKPIDFTPHKRGARSNRVTWHLELPEKWR